MKKFIAIICFVVIMATMFIGCEENGSEKDIKKTIENASSLQTNQPTPTDIEYSLERYNLIRRTYWVNGQREKANALPCEVQKPLGYIVLFSGNTIIANFVVDGKVSSLNSFLTPDSEYYEKNSGYNDWLADVDGSYGENDNGIFFFTPDGKYIEWTGTYLYSDIPFVVDNPIIKMEVND
jgi:predicted small secreted protein